MLNAVVLLHIFADTEIFFKIFFDIYLKFKITTKKNKIETLCNIIIIFTVTFNQFNASLQLKKTILTAPNFWMIVSI